MISSGSRAVRRRCALPQGQFERRVIGAGDAIQMVRIVALAATAINDEGQIVERPNSTPQPFSCVTRARSRGGSDEPISKQGGRRIRGGPSRQGEIKVIGCCQPYVEQSLELASA
jgi:hypothetical protein